MHAFHQVIHSVRQQAVMAVAVTAVLALTSLAEAQAPAKSSPGAEPARLAITLMRPAAAKAGANQFEVMVKGADGKPVNGADVSLLFVMPAMPAMKMPAMRNEVKLVAAGAGTYTGTGQVTMAGTWHVTVNVTKGGKPIGHKTLTLTAR